MFPDSVSLNQDNGLMVGMTLAHETGHRLVDLPYMGIFDDVVVYNN